MIRLHEGRSGSVINTTNPKNTTKTEFVSPPNLVYNEHMDIQQIINAVKQYQPQRIIVFGSASSGTLKPDSDLDIAIVKQTSKPYHDRVIDVRRLVRSTIPVDFFVFTPEEMEQEKKHNPFVREIVTTGRVVYETS